MTQSAVEWLIETHFGSIENCTPNFRNKIKKAIELEKEQQGYNEEEVLDIAKQAFVLGANFGLIGTFNEWF
jgi:hypothetical protein